MKLITRQEKAKNAYSLWVRQYGKEAKDIAEKLLNLGDSPNPCDVDKIIGSSSWTGVHCSECNESKDSAVMVGEGKDYEVFVACVCKSCLIKALACFED